MIRLAGVDDHPHVAIAMRALLDKTPDIRLVAESRRGGDVMTLARQARPDVLLLDLYQAAPPRRTQPHLREVARGLRSGSAAVPQASEAAISRIALTAMMEMGRLCWFMVTP